MTRPTLWFAGTPEFAAYSLERLILNDCYHIDHVFTQPDRPAGRGRKVSKTAVKLIAEKYHLPITQPEKLNQNEPPFNNSVIPDVLVVAAYGLLLPKWLLDYPHVGCINIHASILPRWRGAAPIQRAIAAGDKESGITIMQMDKGLDTGDIWSIKRCPITATMTAGELHDKLMALGADTLLETLPIIIAQNQTPTPQNNQLASYAPKLSKAEAMIDWSQSAQTIARLIRAYNPYPVAHTKLDQQTWRIFNAEVYFPANHSKQPAGTIVAHDEQGIEVVTGDQHLRITELQLAGKKCALAAELRHGHHFVGRKLSS
ncbi:MAG: methionyl-tRNA formyltransferase [Cardiobacteriales bacterium]|nr:MAG: methionyl-tRNA formyltransferase [Cardiobacteriales bacterium]